jgi:glutamate synthase (NADPH/NADH) large chain
MLGAEEFGFATAPLVASGCIMMRKCHLNTCPVGVATQDPELRRRFAGKPEHVINYLFMVAEETRQLMASLGFRRLEEVVGRADCVAPRTTLHPRARRIDFSEVLYLPQEASSTPLHNVEAQDHNLRLVLDHELIQGAQAAIERGERVRLGHRVRNSDRALGAMLSGEIARRHGEVGLPRDTITIEATGSAGQSCGAFLAAGVTITLEGDANDYVGKGLSGGIVALRPPREAPFRAEEQVIAGNTVLYGATSGEAYFNGRAGERFAVRNSGALAIVEGIGDHGCEYMTGGVVLVLGPTGRNFGAGMSGGVAVVLDPDGTLAARCHPEVRDAVEPLSARDGEIIADLVREHARRTGSLLAERLLASWPRAVAQMVKLVPKEYRGALEAQRPEARPTSLSARLAERPPPIRTAPEREQRGEIHG